MGKPIDLTGQRFSSIVAVRRCGTCASRDAKWLFTCDCGAEFEANGYYARIGKVVSCPNCSRNRTREASVTHGLTGSPEYATWTDIQTRCHNPNSISFPNYGGRGIAVCQRWRDSFEAFFADMGQKPSPNHSIDRIDNNKGYEPGNCRWATIDEQANNRRTNRLVTINGETKTVTQWAREYGLNAVTVWLRVKSGKKGWDVICPPHQGSRRGTKKCA